MVPTKRQQKYALPTLYSSPSAPHHFAVSADLRDSLTSLLIKSSRDSIRTIRATFAVALQDSGYTQALRDYVLEMARKHPEVTQKEIQERILDSVRETLAVRAGSVEMETRRRNKRLTEPPALPSAAVEKGVRALNGELAELCEVALDQD